MPERPNEIVAVASSNDIDPKAGHLITAVALAVFAALAVLSAIYVYAMFDDRIRFVGDVRLATHMTGDMPVLNVERAAGAVRISTVLAGLAHAQGAPSVHLVPADAGTNVERLQAEVAATFGDAADGSHRGARHARH